MLIHVGPLSRWFKMLSVSQMKQLKFHCHLDDSWQTFWDRNSSTFHRRGWIFHYKAKFTECTAALSQWKAAVRTSSHPVPEHNRCRSACHSPGLSSRGPIGVFISVMQSRPVERHLPLVVARAPQARATIHCHACTHVKLRLRLHTCIGSLPYRKWNIAI